MARALDEKFHQEQSRPTHQDDQHQDQRGYEVEFTQAAYPAIQAGHHGCGSDHRNAKNEQNLHLGINGNAEQVIEPGIDLRNTETQGGRDTEQGCDDCHDVDDRTQRAVYAIPQERVERTSDRQWQIAVVSKVGQGQSDDGIDGPGVEAPVQEGQVHGPDRRIRGAPGDLWRIVEMNDRFGNAVEQQSDTHSGAEQHGKPGRAGEVGFGVGPADANLAEAAHCQVHREHQECLDQ